MGTKIMAGVSTGAILVFVGWLAKSQYDDNTLLTEVVTIQSTQAKILDDHEVRIRSIENARRHGELMSRPPVDGG